MEPFPDIECMTIERFYNNYLNSKGDPQHRIVELGLWSVDLKLRIKYLRESPEDSEMHRMVYRGKDHVRGRPNCERFIVGSESDSLTKLKITDDEYNWLGDTWFKSNNREMPSLNQIETGLIAEAMKQVEKAMGSISDQND